LPVTVAGPRRIVTGFRVARLAVFGCECGHILSGGSPGVKGSERGHTPASVQRTATMRPMGDSASPSPRRRLSDVAVARQAGARTEGDTR